jgi:hypothetical protein
MNIEFKSVYKEAEIVKVDVPFLRFPGRAEKVHGSRKARYLVPRARHEPSISRIRQIRPLLRLFVRLYSTIKFQRFH